MKIIVKPNASQKHLTALMGRNLSKPSQLSLNNSYSSPGFLSQSRPSRVKKLGGIYSSLRLRFALLSKAEVFALRITDVALPEKPTRQVTHCARTADGYLLVAEETVVHPSLIVPWAVDNHPCTLLWQVREQESQDKEQGQVLIRHITFMRSFEAIYVPQIFLQIMGFFAELNTQDSPFSKFYQELTTKKQHLLQDFKALQKAYAQEMPTDLQYPFIEGFGPPFVVEFQDRVIEIERITAYRVIKDVSVFEQLSQRTVVQPRQEFTPLSSDMLLSQEKAPTKKQSVAPIEEAYGKTEQITPSISPPQPIGTVLQQGLAQLSGNTDLSQSVGVLAAQYSTMSHGSRSFQKNDLGSGEDSYEVRRKPSTASCPYRNQLGKIILSVRSQRRYTEVQKGGKRGNQKLSSVHSHHTGTPPSTLSPRIESMVGGYYRMPSQESKSKELNKSDSLLRPHPADKIEIRKLYPAKESPQPQALIEEKSMEYSRDSYWPSPTPLPPMLAPEARAILRVSPVKRRSEQTSISKPKTKNQFTLHSPSPYNFKPIQKPAPQVPFWMREGSPDELTIQGVQLIESRFNDLDYYY